jgi:FAD/FMN-containing dehydrogenase
MDVPLLMGNFGRNVTWIPSQILEPRNDAEVLSILDRYRGRRIRVVGRLHSWSPVLLAEDVLINLRHLNRVTTQPRDGRVWVEVQAGCQVKTVLEEIEKQAGVTLPSIGLVTAQTFVGAAATGTHGSGKNSLSHYIDEVRVAGYDPETGQPVIRVISKGAELRAARCALGCLGIILSVGLWSRPQYHIEETFRRHRSLDSVLVAAEQFPLQQFYLIPWLWEFIAQHRREVMTPRSRFAWLYHWYFFFVFDITFHFIVQLLIRSGRRALVHGFFRRVLPWTVMKHWQVVDKSQDMLVMKHDLFRHIEMELFVVQSQIHDALAYVQEVLKFIDGDGNALTVATHDRLKTLDLLAKLSTQRGRYTHHYPICVRRVLADDTMMTMSSGTEEPWYAISFISYNRPEDHSQFLAMAEFMAGSMVALFSARPHWGKICPLTTAEANRLYPEIADFRTLCNDFDPRGVFRNDWVQRLIFSESSAEQPSQQSQTHKELEKPIS